MTRFKEELTKHGFKLEHDYPWLPFEIKSVYVETVRVRIEGNKIILTTFYNVGVGIEHLDHNFNVVHRDFI